MSRGYYGIGIFNASQAVNLGTLWRSAYCLGANHIFTIGARYKEQSSDTPKTWRHVPYFRYNDWPDFLGHLPYDCKIVAIEIVERAESLETFVHPERCAYVLGPEDGSLPTEILAECDYIVKFTSTRCLNVAVAGSIVLYDRQAKECFRLVSIRGSR